MKAIGPRGKIYLDKTADWHLFLGDETAAPGYLHMLEALPPDMLAQAYLEVASPEDELSTSTQHDVEWRFRRFAPIVLTVGRVPAA